MRLVMRLPLGVMARPPGCHRGLHRLSGGSRERFGGQVGGGEPVLGAALLAGDADALAGELDFRGGMDLAGNRDELECRELGVGSLGVGEGRDDNSCGKSGKKPVETDGT